MLKTTVKHGRVLSAILIAMFAFPFVSSGDDTGRDWYCEEVEEHARYEKHLKLHLDNEAEAITMMLEKIYSDSSLSDAQKKEKTLDVLNDYLSKMKAGMGD